MRKERVMKKRILALMFALVMCFAVTGCGGSSDTPAASGESESEAEESAGYPVTLADNDYFTFELDDCGSVMQSYDYTIKNNTDKDIIFDCEKVVVNDKYTVDAFIYSDMAAGTETSDTFYLDSAQIEKIETGEKMSIKIKYSIVDNNSYDTLKEGDFTFEVTK